MEITAVIFFLISHNFPSSSLLFHANELNKTHLENHKHPSVNARNSLLKVRFFSGSSKASPMFFSLSRLHLNGKTRSQPTHASIQSPAFIRYRSRSSDSLQNAAASRTERNLEQIFHGKGKNRNSPEWIVPSAPQQFSALDSEGVVFEDSTPVSGAQPISIIKRSKGSSCCCSIYIVENSVQKTVCGFWVETVFYTCGSWSRATSCRFKWRTIWKVYSHNC